MTLTLASILGFAVLATSFLSGIFGMLGGLILMGVLLFILPVSSAMALHAVTQMTSNGWRAFLWRNHIIAGLLPGYIAGSLLVFIIFALVSVSLPKAWVYLFLGLVPYIALSVPSSLAPDINRKNATFFVGSMIMALNVIAGVSGPLLDIFFVRTALDRREIVSTKAMTQTIGHFFKLVYFTLIIPTPSEVSVSLPWWLYLFSMAIAVIGTYSARHILERISNKSYLQWSRVLALVIGATYLYQALQLLF